MVIPESVRSYWDAQWWEFLHIVVPGCGVIVVLLLWIGWWNARSESKDEKETRPGKVLDL